MVRLSLRGIIAVAALVTAATARPWREHLSRPYFPGDDCYMVTYDCAIAPTDPCCDPYFHSRLWDDLNPNVLSGTKVARRDVPALFGPERDSVSLGAQGKEEVKGEEKKDEGKEGEAKANEQPNR